MMATIKTTTRQYGLPIQQIQAAAVRAVNDTLEKVDADFQSTFSTFSHKPTMHKERAKISGRTVMAREWTDDENYVRLNYGTVAHDVGRSGQYMSFYPGYRKKTKPGRLRATNGGPYGKRQRAKGPWMVSGIPARNFDETVAKHARPYLRRVLELELRKIR